MMVLLQKMHLEESSRLMPLIDTILKKYKDSNNSMQLGQSFASGSSPFFSCLTRVAFLSGCSCMHEPTGIWLIF